MPATLLRRSIVLARAFAIGPLLVAGCGGGVADPGPRPARNELPRPLSTQEQQVASSANAFSFALWQKLNGSSSPVNIFVSPLSASFSLGMTLNGAAGQTLDEMRAALQLGTTSVADIDAGYKSLIALLTSLDPAVTIDIANSIWYRNTFTVNKSFTDAVTASFGATVEPLAFNDVNGSLARINGWVDTRTNHKIQSILDGIDPNDVMFLINAIYFKAGWRDKFDPSKTLTEPFHGASGDHTVSLMHRNAKMPYAETATYQAVDLAYGDSAFSMTVLLPKSGTTVDALATSLTAASWATLSASFNTALVDLALPKMRIEWEKSLIPELQALGMNAPFINADFTPMSPAGRQLVISQVRQKAFVDVNEEGTEAAAVTVTGVTVTSAPIAREMRVDRPFIFAIRERLTGTVLFMGKVVSLP